MEKIELRVEKFAGADVGRHWCAVFGVAGGTIGRGGQNKLVLPDTDAGVARVHAMVRLESDAAFIANLCERRSMRVSGMDVLSGQEVQLHIGAEVQIGPYSLRAVPPGTPPTKAVTAAQRPVPVATVATSVPTEPVVAAKSALASTPNPWADIPQQAWNEGRAASASMPSLPAHADQVSLDALLSNSIPSTTSPDADNPFAMLGRVEAGGAPSPEVGQEASNWREVNLSATQPRATVSQTQAQTTAAHAPMVAATAQNRAPLPDSHSANLSTSALPNVFDGLGIPLRPAQAPRSDRPLLIPADFDPFARDLKKENAAQDPWAGGLPEQSLSQVANIQSDELIRSLPLKGKLDDALDNPAHSGLPKALDPKLETDPMRLFGTAGIMDGMVVANAETARGPELVQVFSLPKGVDPGAQGLRNVLAPAAPHPKPGELAESDMGGSQSSNATNVQALGLLPTQGLDLALFGGAGVPVATHTSSTVATAASTADASGTSSREAASALPDSHQKPVWEVPQSQADAGAFLPEKIVPHRAASVTSKAAVMAGHGDAALDLNLDQPPPASARKAVVPEPLSGGAVPNAQLLMDAFLEGAGLAPGRVEALMTPDFMRQFGEAFRVAIQGTIELLAARSEIKREFRADVTVIAPRANNPLKFLPNADGVIMQMVGQSFPGFMKPVPSMKEAYFDLQVHQLALMAGIRAAYAEALARFDPAELEKRCDSNAGVLSKISTTARKAAVWDEYKQSYNAIRRHAEDDLVAFSGEAFVKAYDAAAEAAREYP